jgi:hypothetical protein
MCRAPHGKTRVAYRKRYQFLRGAVSAAQAQKAVGQDAACEKGIEIEQTVKLLQIAGIKAE